MVGLVYWISVHFMGSVYRKDVIEKFVMRVGDVAGFGAVRSVLDPIYSDLLFRARLVCGNKVRFRVEGIIDYVLYKWSVE